MMVCLGPSMWGIGTICGKTGPPNEKGNRRCCTPRKKENNESPFETGGGNSFLRGGEGARVCVLFIKTLGGHDSYVGRSATTSQIPVLCPAVGKY